MTTHLYRQLCDKCYTPIDNEEDIFEQILCRNCNYKKPQPEKHRCARCGIVLLFQGIFNQMKKLLPKLKIPGLVLAALALVAVVLRFISKVMALKFLFGVGGVIGALLALAVGLVVLIASLVLLTVGLHYVGERVRRFFNLDWPSGFNTAGYADGAVIFGSLLWWFVGLVIVSSPYTVYLLGNVLYGHFVG